MTLTEKPPGLYGARSIAEVPINTANAPVINAVYPPSEFASGNSRCVRKAHPKLSPNEQPQGPPTEDEHAY